VQSPAQGQGAPPAGTVYSARQLRARRLLRFRRPRLGGKRPFTWRRALKWTALGMAVVLVVAIALSLTAYFKVNGDIKTFSEAGASTTGATVTRPDQTAGQNILLVGSDSRANGNSALGGGAVTGANSDTTMLLHVSADGHHATLVSIPRDTLTTIPPCLLPNGTWTSTQTLTIFNSAFGTGGTTTGNPVCTQNTVEKMTGLRIDHTIMIDFEGVGAIATAVGGVQVTLPNAVNSYGINLPAGTYKVEGKEAVAYVRVRHGLGDNSDIGRMQRQQAFMKSLLSDILKMDLPLHPIKLYQLSDAIAKAITVDPGIGSASSMLGLAYDMRNLTMKNMTFLTMPWNFAGARVLPKEPDATNLWTMLKNDKTVPANYN
jgi:LCP family protein required for cell wall assembly